MTDPLNPQGPINSETRALARILDHHRVSLVLDVGAHVGEYGLRLRRGDYLGWIVSIEPMRDLHRSLRAAAMGDDRWRVVPPLALGDHNGTVMVQGPSDTSEDGDEIPLARLDHVLDDHAGPDDRVFLRLGGQHGSDFDVLRGAAGVLERIRGLHMELALVPVYPGEPDYLDAIGHLAGLGFTPVLFSPGYFNRRSARQLTMDVVFARLNDGGAG